MTRSMVKVIEAPNVNHALVDGLYYLRAVGVPAPSRNGPVLVAPGPVLTHYHYPKERVLFSAGRNANPFFHFMEALWMLAGRNDIGFLTQYNKRMVDYSDDGVTQWGAYGHRWRRWFGYDQLDIIIDELSANPTSRRCVLAMWDACGDEGTGHELGADLMAATHGGKDVPCNTHAYVQIMDGELDLTVCCRSNDMYWGAHGANAVHFSMLQEYLAAHIGVPVGQLYQLSNNYHLYTDVVGVFENHALYLLDDRYRHSRPPAVACPMVKDPIAWDADLERFMGTAPPVFGYTEPFFEQIATKLRTAWWCHRHTTTGEAIAVLQSRAGLLYSQQSDWLIAAEDWLLRAQEKQNAKS